MAAETTGDLVPATVARIADDTATMHQLAGRRWPQIIAALLGGAGQTQVAEAAGVDLVELRRGVITWASTLVEAGLLDVAQHADVVHAVIGLPE